MSPGALNTQRLAVLSTVSGGGRLLAVAPLALFENLCCAHETVVVVMGGGALLAALGVERAPSEMTEV